MYNWRTVNSPTKLTKCNTCSNHILQTMNKATKIILIFNVLHWQRTKHIVHFAEMLK